MQSFSINFETNKKKFKKYYLFIFMWKMNNLWTYYWISIIYVNQFNWN